MLIVLLARVRSFSLLVVALAVLIVPGVTAPSASAAVVTALKRYPYLSDAVDSYVTVNWATDRSSTTGAVKWGRVSTTDGSCTAGTNVPASRAGISVNGVSQYQWRATFSVGSAAEFCYRVYLGSAGLDLLGTDPSPRAKPQVPVGSTQSYSFAVLGDTGEVDGNGDNAAQSAVMNHIAGSGARFAIQTGDFGHPNNDQKSFGDLVQKGANTSAVFGPAFWKSAGSKIPMFTVPGNHGITNSSLLVNFPQNRAVSTSSGTYAMQTYCCVNGTVSQSQQSGWYAFNAGNARYYILTAAWSDSNLGTLPGTNRSVKLYQNDYDAHWAPGLAEYEWLKADLDAHADTPVKMAFFHFPMYSDQAAETSDTNLQGSGRLEGLLTRNGVDIAFNGHAHTYQRNTKSPLGLVTYVTGGGGADTQSIGPCSSIDAYGIGWSGSNNAGNKCGSAPLPTSESQVYHYLLVTVNGTNVTVTPVNSSGQTFDVQSYDFSVASPPSDTQAPSAPANLTATATSSTSVALSWTASTDNVAVTGYDVYRNGTLLKSVTGTSTTDTTVGAGTSYTYTVKAKDAAGNTSVGSNPATVTTVPTGGAETVFAAAADARIEQSNPAGNYGTSTTLGADQSSTSQIESYLKFNVANLTGTPTSAKLRVWTTTGSTSPTTNGPAAYPVPDTSWTETGINWNNKPSAGTTALDDKGVLTADTLVEYDVTSLVTGNGTYTIKLTPDSGDGTSFNSRETSTTTKRPQLVVTTGQSSSDTQAPSAPANLTATATSSTSVALSWTASTDNVAVTGYDVYRNGTLLKSVTGTSTTDTTVGAGTSYTYTVKAKDAAGNTSVGSNPATVTTVPTGGAETVFAAAADARIEQSNPASNYGTSTTLGADQSSTSQIESYLKFNVANLTGTPTSAKLRVWTTTGSTSPTTNGPAAYPVPDTSWTETGINWNNKPSAGTTALDDKGVLTADTLVEYDVTSLVTGNGTYTIKLTPDSGDGTSFNSRETSTTTKRPQLVVTTS